MKIGIATFGCDGGRSGIGQYLIQLVRGFTAANPGHEYELLVCESELDIFAPLHDSITQVCFPDHIAKPVRNVAWHQLSLPRWCHKRGYDALFLAAANRRVPIHAPCPVIGTVHDLAPVHVKGKYDPARQFYVRHVLPFLIRRLDRVITVSECSKRDIVQYGGVAADRVSVVPNGVDHAVYGRRHKGAAAAAMSARFGLDRPYVLYVSRLEHPGKNHVRLIEAFERYKQTHGGAHLLVLAGPDKERAEEVHQRAEASPFAADIRFTGFVADADMPDLYAAAEAFVMPSLFEGFGIPVIEAMASGVPVACSNTSSLPEVAGTAGLLFDPTDVNAIASSLASLLRDEEIRARCIERGLARSARYSWTQAARDTLAIIEAAAAPHKEVTSHALPRFGARSSAA